MNNNPIPYGKQNITQSDIDAVVEVLKSDYLTQGPVVKEFEEAFAEYVGAKYAVAVANGTAALHLNCLALGVKPGDKVITTPITFAASANCVSYCGGEVVFADIEPETYLLDINEVRKQLEADKDIVGIIPVDFAGRCVDMQAFRQLADEFNCWIIEDACHAPGGFFENSAGEQAKAGSGRYADLAIFSFHPVKHIAAGEGGMITTNDKELYEKLLELRTHGITKDSDLFKNNKHLAVGNWPLANSQPLTANSQQPKANSQWPAWYMEMQSLGYNYRISDINCALGLSQLNRANEGLRKRHEIAARYYEAFKNIPQITDHNHESANSQRPTANSQRLTANSQRLTAKSQQLTAKSHRVPRIREQLPCPENSGTANGHAHHLYVIETQNRFELYNHLRKNKIFAQIHHIPLHLMPYYSELGWKQGDFPNAESYYSGCISLPMYPSYSEIEQELVLNTIRSFYNEK